MLSLQWGGGGPDWTVNTKHKGCTVPQLVVPERFTGRGLISKDTFYCTHCLQGAFPLTISMGEGGKNLLNDL